jgi:amino acid transporter
MKVENNIKRFGTAPVYFTSISTIFGAILFLRFGYAVGTLGFWGVFLIILLGHAITIPTAMAISELATNKRVEGGGEYFIISRSFGLNIGATVGISLFLSQAISVAFYIIAFTEAFEFFFNWIEKNYEIILPRQAISLPVMLLLSFMILKKGANLGVKTLYFVIGILALSLLLFFMGKTAYSETSDFKLLFAQFRNSDKFFIVFAIVFPAFTGMTAGVGLSGNLKNPARSIPIGTIAATFTGMLIYILIIYKLAQSVSPTDLVNNQLIMSKIAIAGNYIIPLGLAASTLSSALGSIMVAPRTLQALASDRSFPSVWINRWLSKSRESDGEPYNATLITCLIALIFVALGNINAVASIISMFFMVTYGSLCLISFLNHFGSSPSYRPSFKSKWYFSLTGFIISIWVMFKINTPYAVLAISLMILVYLYINRYHSDRSGIQAIFLNAIFKINRNFQLYLQQKSGKVKYMEWRPSAVCISSDSFKRDTAIRFLNWLSHKYGFGTYLHFIEGYYSKTTNEKAKKELQKLINNVRNLAKHVYIDTIISPSFTSAIAQTIQIPGIAGMENNLMVFEYDKEDPVNLQNIIKNFHLVNAGDFDICVIGSSRKTINFNNGIHVWIKSSEQENANLMILMSFIILNHPEWKNADIKIFEVCQQDEIAKIRAQLHELVVSGRLPITTNNIQIITKNPEVSIKSLINERSTEAGLILTGIRETTINEHHEELFLGFDDVGTIIFVFSHSQKVIE